MVVPLGACRKGALAPRRRHLPRQVGAVGTILWLQIAAAGVSYVPFAGSLVTLGFGAWLLRSAVHANGDDRRHHARKSHLLPAVRPCAPENSMWWALRQPMG